MWWKYQQYVFFYTVMFINFHIMEKKYYACYLLLYIIWLPTYQNIFFCDQKKKFIQMRKNK